MAMLKHNYPIPNMLEKHGGLMKLKPAILDFTQRQLVVPSIRRCYKGLSSEQIIEYNCAMLAFILGQPVVNYNFSLVRDTLIDNDVTLHAYEEIVRLLRHVLLDAGLESRDISIAINVLDIHSDAIVGVRISRPINSPFSGVDRRRRNRIAHAADTAAAIDVC